MHVLFYSCKARSQADMLACLFSAAAARAKDPAAYCGGHTLFQTK